MYAVSTNCVIYGNVCLQILSFYTFFSNSIVNRWFDSDVDGGRAKFSNMNSGRKEL